MLKIEGLACGYGSMQVLHEVTLEVCEGELVALIGSNGAGKSTLLNTISGLLRPWAGHLTFLGRELGGMAPEVVARLGAVQVPEGRQLFTTLTVRENLEMGGYLRSSTGGRRSLQRDLERVFDLFPRLKERERQVAGTLSGGEQQMLAVGRALMCGARLLMLDEPSLGLAPILRRMIFQTLWELHQDGVTILLVEQNARAALIMAQRAYVLEQGRIVLQGSGQDLLHRDEVQKHYLGTAVSGQSIAGQDDLKNQEGSP